MKNILIIYLFLFFSVSNSEKITTYTLHEAIKKKIITYKVSGNENGTHYSKALKIKIINKSKKGINIVIDNGLMFEPVDSMYQNMVSTKKLIVKIPSRKSKTTAIYAMCTESSDAAPSMSTIYRLAKKTAGERLSKLTKLIEKLKITTSYEAQQAVWTLIEKRNLNAIEGYDSVISNRLIKYVADISNRKVPAKIENSYYRHTTMTQGVKGNFYYEIAKTSEVKIAMFSKNRIVVRELYYKKNVKPGSHNFKYEFDSTQYTDDLYYIKLLINGEVFLTVKHVPYK